MTYFLPVETLQRIAANATIEALNSVSTAMLKRRFLEAIATDLAPLRERFKVLIEQLDTDDKAARAAAMAAFESDLPHLLEKMQAGGRTADALADLMSHAASRSIETRAVRSTASNAISWAEAPSRDALDYLGQKSVLPTTGRTWNLDKLPAEIRERAAFSAGVTQAEFIARAYAGARQLAAGTSDRATMRLQLKQMLGGMDYQPAKGKEGGLQDLSSDARLNLILDTNSAQARGYAWDQAGQDQDLLDAYPAEEFLRVEDRDHPRTTWQALWNKKRAEVGSEGATDSGSGRMVALKNHPIWRAINRFGNDYEPFDFGSGMGKEDVDREDAVALGIIKPSQRIEPQERSFNDRLQASPEIMSGSLRSALEATGLGRFDSSGVFHFKEAA
ncbi:MAG: hypothetical protein WC378_17460 [Opitutaceae bacterium]|jgi:hypothetical protein